MSNQRQITPNQIRLVDTEGYWTRKVRAQARGCERGTGRAK